MELNRKIRVAIVGVGGMGGVHFNIYCKKTDIELVAACDLRIDMLREKAKKNGREDVTLYADYDEMLAKEKPDMVDICTPTYLHAEMAVKAMRAGAYALSEKPMALNSGLTEQILAAEKETGKFYMTAQVVRFMTPYRYLKDVIDSKKYGNPVHVMMYRMSQGPAWGTGNWYLQEEKSGLVMLDLMIHDIDFMQYAFGKPKSIDGAYHPLRDGSNSATAVYLYDGFTVTIETGWFQAAIPFHADFYAVFDKGWVESRNGTIYDCGKPVEIPREGVTGETGINISNVDGYETEINEFIEAVRTGVRPMTVPSESSAYTIRLVEETRKAMKNF